MSDSSPSSPSRASRLRSATSPNLPLETGQTIEEGDDPRTNPSDPTSSSSATQHPSPQEGDDDGDDERMDIKLIQGFAESVSNALKSLLSLFSN